MKDYYAILDVPPTASQTAIREQYLLLIQAWHPDKFPNPAQRAKAEEKCKEINNAYAVLKDTQKRAKYDREVRRPPSGSGPAETRRDAGARRQRAQTQEAHQRQAEGQWQQREQAESERPGTDPETRARQEQEWIRIYFEQARRRQSQPPVRVGHHSVEPIQVLVVGDVAEGRAHIRKLLSGETDIRVIGEAPDGLDAVRKFDALTPDVMIACLRLPDVDSLATTEAILRNHPMAKVVILSPQSFPGFIRRAAMTGACDYLVSPAAAEELRLAIRLAAARAKPTC